MAIKNTLSFWRRFCYKFRVTLTDEGLHEEKACFYLSGLKLTSVGVLLTVILLSAGALLVVCTPLHRYVPGYTDEGFRAKLIANSLQVDSLADVVQKQDAYILNLRNVMQGTIPVDTACLNDSILRRPHEEIIPVSDEEMAFSEAYEKELTQQNEAKKPTSKALRFVSPLKGKITRSFDVEKQQYGITLTVQADRKVKAVLTGIVMQSMENKKGEAIVEVQHAQGMVSIYRFKGAIVKKIGDRVKGNEMLGEVDAEGIHTLTYELWQDGLPQNPMRYFKI